MNRDDSPTVLNLSDASVKRQLMLRISILQGLHDVSIKPRKRTRSLDQNSYYWIAVVQPFRDWLRDSYGDALITSDQAHEMLKVKILGMDEKLIEGTNEVLKLIPRSKTLTKDEFGTFIDKASSWLLEFCNIVVVPSEMFYESK